MRAGDADLHVVPVHPRELLGIEHAGAVADVLEREAPRQLVHRHQLGIVGRLAAAGARRPADQRQVVDQRLRQVAALAELRHRRRAVALRQRRVIRPEHHREVREARRREAERAIQQHLPRRVRDVILAADHVRHLHQRIVHDDGEVVGGTAVGADEHRIADDVGAERHFAADEILERDVDVLGHAEADDARARPRRCRRRASSGGIERHVPR